MNSPCAMLITPIWPKMIASPSAISRNTENRIRPAKPCIARIEPSSASEYSPNIAVAPCLLLLMPLPIANLGEAACPGCRDRGTRTVRYW